jgi:L-seryl-tRNA(Ser) seleniumtransferase
MDDYRRAAGEQTALLMKVHTSNFRLRGFTHEVTPDELATLGAELGLPTCFDLGSGLLETADMRPLPLGDEPRVRAAVSSGVDLVLFSGDKLLGGPQAGLLLGRADLVERCRRHPLYRALRPSRLAYAALEGVLRRQLAGEPGALEALWPEPVAHQRRVREVAEALGGDVVIAEAFVGGGAAPETPIPGPAVALTGDERLLRRLRLGEPPVVGYVRDGRLVLDLRTVAPADDAALVAAVRAALAGRPARAAAAPTGATPEGRA